MCYEKVNMHRNGQYTITIRNYNPERDEGTIILSEKIEVYVEINRKKYIIPGGSKIRLGDISHIYKEIGPMNGNNVEIKVDRAKLTSRIHDSITEEIIARDTSSWYEKETERNED